MVRRKVPSLERASSKYMFCLSHRKATRTQASQTDVSYVHVFRLIGQHEEPSSDRLVRMGPFGGREYTFLSDAYDSITPPGRPYRGENGLIRQSDDEG